MYWSNATHPVYHGPRKICQTVFWACIQIMAGVTARVNQTPPRPMSGQGWVIDLQHHGWPHSHWAIPLLSVGTKICFGERFWCSSKFHSVECMFPSQEGDKVVNLCLKIVSEMIAVRPLGCFHASIRNTHTYLSTYLPCNLLGIALIFACPPV